MGGLQRDGQTALLTSLLTTVTRRAHWTLYSRCSMPALFLELFSCCVEPPMSQEMQDRIKKKRLDYEARMVSTDGTEPVPLERSDVLVEEQTDAGSGASPSSFLNSTEGTPIHIDKSSMPQNSPTLDWMDSWLAVDPSKPRLRIEWKNNKRVYEAGSEPVS